MFSTLLKENSKYKRLLHMNTILSRVDSLRRVLIVGLVSLSLWGVTFVTPAHAGNGIEQPSGGIEYFKNDRGDIQTTERYNQIQPEIGGMNKFSDTDPRVDTRKTDAQVLTDTASRRKAQASDPLEPARKTLRNAKDKVGDAVEDMAEKVGR